MERLYTYVYTNTSCRKRSSLWLLLFFVFSLSTGLTSSSLNFFCHCIFCVLIFLLFAVNLRTFSSTLDQAAKTLLVKSSFIVYNVRPHKNLRKRKYLENTAHNKRNKSREIVTFFTIFSFYYVKWAYYGFLFFSSWDLPLVSFTLNIDKMICKEIFVAACISM